MRPSRNESPLIYWVREREAIRTKRERNDAAPWTDDPILRDYRFCNVRRRHDRVSRWIIESIINPYAKHPNLPVMLALARQVNWPDTLQEIMDAGLWPRSSTPGWRAIGELIDARAARGDKAWTGAYMIRAESNPQAEWYRWGKGRYIAEIVVGREIWSNRKEIAIALRSGSIETACGSIAGRYGWGSFMAGQLVADLTYSPALERATDLYEWAPLGPGSRRGLNRLAGRSTNAPITQERAVVEMRALRADMIEQLGRSYRDLTLHDVQNCLCEVDKYLRVKNGEGRPRSKFVPTLTHSDQSSATNQIRVLTKSE